MNLPAFVYTTCQVGAENAVKGELQREHPELHFAYSRPGFLTFKFVAAHLPLDRFRLRSVFARAWGICLGKVPGSTSSERAAAFREMLAEPRWELRSPQSVRELHVWQRDAAPPRDLPEPTGRSPAVLEAEQALREALGGEVQTPQSTDGVPRETEAFVADCILVEPDEWWAGWHIARTVCEHWPGGLMIDPLPPEAVSRGYLKMREMLRWSELPISPGDTCVEFGCSPGGASQQLLSRGLQVIGIDPADMHETVLADPHFTHIRARPRDLKRKLFRGIPWLVSDINLPPQYTLDTLEDIVRHPGVEFLGLLLTLKLPEWKLADEVPEYLERIRGWGFRDVRARQLHHNRREICVAVRA